MYCCDCTAQEVFTGNAVLGGLVNSRELVNVAVGPSTLLIVLLATIAMFFRNIALLGSSPQSSADGAWPATGIIRGEISLRGGWLEKISGFEQIFRLSLRATAKCSLRREGTNR